VGGALLVAYQNVVDYGELAQGVVCGQDGSAGIAEDGGDALADEGGPEDFGAGELGVLVRFVGHLLSPGVLESVCKDDAGER
jgi:hypothetical protein